MMRDGARTMLNDVIKVVETSRVLCHQIRWISDNADLGISVSEDDFFDVLFEDLHRTEDWRKVLREATGEDLSTRAMVEYYQPLMKWLEEQNKGRQIGWE